jgi:hypothetical protein
MAGMTHADRAHAVQRLLDAEFDHHRHVVGAITDECRARLERAALEHVTRVELLRDAKDKAERGEWIALHLPWGDGS